MDNLELYYDISNDLAKIFNYTKFDIERAVNLGKMPELNDGRVYLEFISCKRIVERILKCVEKLYVNEKVNNFDIEIKNQIIQLAEDGDSKIREIKTQKLNYAPILQNIINVCQQGNGEETFLEARKIINKTFNENNYEKSKQVRTVLNEFLSNVEVIVDKELLKYKKQILLYEIENEK